VRIILAYSGTLETSVAIPWLAERYGAEVIAVSIDLGQGRELEEVRDRALVTGAVRAHVLDARDEFARELIVPALKADASAEFPGGTSAMLRALGRPLIARKLVEIADIEQADAIAHGSGGMAIEATARVLNPAMRVLAAARDARMTPVQQRDYAAARHLTLPPEADSSFAVLDPPREAAAVDVSFERGVPTGINGVAMPLLDLFESLGTIAVAHRIGVRGRDLRDAPAAGILSAAHLALRTLIDSEDLNRLCRTVGREYADAIRDGRWYAPAREAMDAFFNSVDGRVTGIVRLKLSAGDCQIVDARETSADSVARIPMTRVS